MRKIYRLFNVKQPAHAWNQKLREVWLKNSFKQSMADPCLFTKTNEDESILIILCVDDLHISCKDEIKIYKVSDILKEHFEVKNLGDVKHYLRINIQNNIAGTSELNKKN